MLEYGLAFARVRVNLGRVKIQFQPVIRFCLQQIYQTLECFIMIPDTSNVKKMNRLLTVLQPITLQFNGPIGSITRAYINTIHRRYDVTLTLKMPTAQVVEISAILLSIFSKLDSPGRSN